MNEIRRRQIIRQLREIGMVEMKATGRWGLTSAGRDFLDQVAVLAELDDRPGAAQDSAPWRAAPPAQQTGTAAVSRSTRSGDEGRPRRGARRKTSGR